VKRDDILGRLGELVGLVEAARSSEDIPTLAALIAERDDLRDELRTHAPLSLDDMRRELEGLRGHLGRLEPSGTMELALGEESAVGMATAVGAVGAHQATSDPHSAAAWIRQRIAFLEEQIRKG
jgi:hypothetical protein